MRRSLRLVGLFLAAAAGLAVGGSELVGPDEAAGRERPAVEWGGTTHTTEESLEAWLSERGLSYRAWAYQHPIAALRLEQAAERAERATTDGGQSVGPTTERRVSPVLLAFVVAIGLALSTVAILLSPAPIRFNPSLRFASDRRAYLALAGAACMAAAAASYAVQV